MGLTRQQNALLNFIRAYMADNCGVPPSFDEMKDGLDLRSKSGIHRLINALVDRGFLRRIPNRARALELVESAGLHIRLPAELEERVCLIAETSGVTPSEIVTRMVRNECVRALSQFVSSNS